MMKRTVAGVAATLVAVVILFVAVFPTRSYFEQRRSRHQLEAQITKLARQNEALDDRIKLLKTDGETERLARERYNLVRPGEEAYAILPSRSAPAERKPEFSAQADARPNWWGRFVQRVRAVL